MFCHKRVKCSFYFSEYSSVITIKLQALGLKRDDTFSVTMLGHCIEMYIGDSDAYIGKLIFLSLHKNKSGLSIVYQYAQN